MTWAGLGGRTALVTGAGRGIGLATAVRPAAEGCTFAAADRDAAPLEEAAQSAIESLRAPGEEAASREGLSERVPLGRYGSADEVAAAVARPLSDESSFVDGALVSLDGGVAVC